jgi:hypothetical protein
MKYLKLITEPSLPDNKHITFAYFGKNQVSLSDLKKHLDKLSKFNLIVSHNDNYGDKNDIPCVVFIIDSLIDVKEIRKQMLIELKQDHQNYLEWSPHISDIQMNDLDNTIYKVTGIKSNDSLFGIMF